RMDIPTRRRYLMTATPPLMRLVRSHSPAPLSPTLVAALLFVSGGCALTYQVAWLRMLRLVFGGTTAASATVLAIVLGGLGFGGIVFGPRVDRSPNALKLYGLLELGVAGGAMVSPLLLTLIRHVYVALGGTTALGMAGGTLLRLALSAVVLGGPTLVM